MLVELGDLPGALTPRAQRHHDQCTCDRDTSGDEKYEAHAILLERAFDRAAIHAQCGAAGRGGERARDIGHHARHLLRGAETLDQRSRSNVFEEILLDLCTALSLFARQLLDEVAHAT